MSSYIKSAWDYAKIAYEEPSGSEPIFSDAINFIHIVTEMDYAYFAEFEDMVVVGVRGTDTKEKGVRGIKTWLSNIDAYPLRELEDAVKSGRSPEEVLRQAGLIKDGEWGKGTIHDGFYTMWKRFKPQLDSLIKSVRVNSKPVLSTGHSRGGPMAELFARHIVKNVGWDRSMVSCVTFGAPAAGTKDYREEFRNIGIRAINVVNGYDMVPTLPPRLLGFRHGSYRKWMSQPSWHKILMRIRDHLPENYTKRISKL